MGADHRSDGKTLWTTRQSGLVTESCSAMRPAQRVQGGAQEEQPVLR